MLGWSFLERCSGSVADRSTAASEYGLVRASVINELAGGLESENMPVLQLLELQQSRALHYSLASWQEPGEEGKQEQLVLKEEEARV